MRFAMLVGTFARSFSATRMASWYSSMKAGKARCPFRKSCASALLGAPGSGSAPEATRDRGGPRDNPGELAADVCNRHLEGQSHVCRLGVPFPLYLFKTTL